MKTWSFLTLWITVLFVVLILWLGLVPGVVFWAAIKTVVLAIAAATFVFSFLLEFVAFRKAAPPKLPPYPDIHGPPIMFEGLTQLRDDSEHPAVSRTGMVPVPHEQAQDA